MQIGNLYFLSLARVARARRERGGSFLSDSRVKKRVNEWDSINCNIVSTRMILL